MLPSALTGRSSFCMAASPTREMRTGHTRDMAVWWGTAMNERTVVVAGRNVSIDLEEQFWECLEDLAVRRKLSLRSLVANIAEQYPLDIASALRLLVLDDVLQTAEIELTPMRTPCERIKRYH
jgi:predicted DNA-binding ribbon-helix-helix protein